jgi:hypothetical protein
VAITPANVKWLSGTPASVGIAGATITAGQVLYLNPTTSQYGLAKAGSAAPICLAQYLALTGGTVGQAIMVAGPGAVIALGGTCIVGIPFYMSNNNAGGIAPASDITTGWGFSTILGFGVTTANFLIQPTPSGITQ